MVHCKYSHRHPVPPYPPAKHRDPQTRHTLTPDGVPLLATKKVKSAAKQKKINLEGRQQTQLLSNGMWALKQNSRVLSP